MVNVAPGFNATQIVAPFPRLTGSMMNAPRGTARPTHSYDVIPNTYTDLGYSDDNGLKQREARATTDHFAWGGDFLGFTQQSYSRTMTVKLYQFASEPVLAAAYGANNVTTTAPTGSYGTEWAVAMNALLLDDMSWVFDGFYKEVLVRVVLPWARVEKVGDVDFTHKTLTSVELTLRAFPDPLKNHGYLYVNSGLNTQPAS